MGSHRVTTRTGKTVILLDPAGKGKKYSAELKGGKRLTNSGKPKVTESGEVQKLSKAQRSYRAGYLDARKDSAKAWCANHGVKSKAKKRTRKPAAARSGNKRTTAGKF